MQSVLIDRTVYVGGGDADGDNNFIVMMYDTILGQWAKLPPYFVTNFGMTALNNQLVLAGGDNHWSETTKALSVWQPETSEWSQPFPELPTPRSGCSAVGYQEWLIVAGGLSTNLYYHYQGTDLKLPVEVLNTESNQWHTLPKTPKPWAGMRPHVVDDVCYFMGGTKVHNGSYSGWTRSVYTLSLPALLSALNGGDKIEKQMWSKIPKVKFIRASPLFFNGSLLAVGGVDSSSYYLFAASIFVYRFDSKQWEKVADLPEPRIDCTCVVTPDGEVLVAGGHSYNTSEKKTVRVELVRMS